MHVTTAPVDPWHVREALNTYIQDSPPDVVERMRTAMALLTNHDLALRSTFEACTLAEAALHSSIEGYQDALAGCRPLRQEWARQLRSDVFEAKVRSGAGVRAPMSMALKERLRNGSNHLNQTGLRSPQADCA